MLFLARLMALFARTKFYNFHGQPGARLEADQSVYSKAGDEQQSSSIFFAPIDFLFFYAPSAQIRKLEEIWVDKVVHYTRWKTFVSGLNNEWNGFTIYSTVMLAVDVSFLAVPGVDIGGVGSQSVATIATYMSLLSVVGSLVSSVLLARQSRAQKESAIGAAAFMDSMTCWGVGMKALGVMFSLPFALLLWAYV
ncbi:hypothetical protein HYDPIDRAFT_33784 [Hydnomerulius pinastri MD-312]|uniref:Uncharacterized protein n=1 Tax=Hydnomerulius pinastri MD-312 TaxID=994086 RepID=A0A0C9W7I3_9AGAM|nr:hypothetical protein HYDPIDRAFT_33784 [Hydnomerulius pinastri MD-312]